MAFWNSKILSAPPTISCKGYINHAELKNIKIVLTEGIQYFEGEQLMFAESEVLARIIYRLRTKFRSSKDLKSLAKLQHALKNYFSVNLATNLKNILHLLPRNVQDKESFLPTRNMFDYVLVRLQGLTKLTERIFNTAKIAAYELKQRVNTGHFWKVAIIVLAVAARVLVLAKHTAKCLCELYDKLFPFREKFNNTSGNWIPEHHILPINLKDWLNVDWIDEEYVPEIPSRKLKMLDFFNLVGPDEDDDVQFCDEYVLVDDDQEVEFIREFKNVLKQPPKLQSTDNLLRGFSFEEDIGEIVNIKKIENISKKPLESDVFKVNAEEVIDKVEILSSDSSDIGIEISNSLKQSEETETLGNSDLVLVYPPKKPKHKQNQKKQKKLRDSVILIKDDESVIWVESNKSAPKNNVSSINKKNRKRKLNATTTEANRSRDCKSEIDASVISLDVSNVAIKQNKNKKSKLNTTINASTTEANRSRDCRSEVDANVISLDGSNVAVKQNKNKKRKLNTTTKAVQDGIGESKLSVKKTKRNKNIHSNLSPIQFSNESKKLKKKKLHKTKNQNHKESTKNENVCQNNNESVIFPRSSRSETDLPKIKSKKQKRLLSKTGNIYQEILMLPETKNKNSKSIVSLLSDDSFFSRAALKLKKSKNKESSINISKRLSMEHSLQSQSRIEKIKKKLGKIKGIHKKLSKRLSIENSLQSKSRIEKIKKKQGKIKGIRKKRSE